MSAHSVRIYKVTTDTWWEQWHRLALKRIVTRFSDVPTFDPTDNWKRTWKQIKRLFYFGLAEVSLRFYLHWNRLASLEVRLTPEPR